MHATIGGFESVVCSLLAHGARIGCLDQQQRSAMHWAAVHRREGVLGVLLGYCAGKGDVVDGRDAHGKTALGLAVESGFEAGVEMLL